jgi:hypothetical protein
MSHKEDEKKTDDEATINAGLAGAAAEVVDRYGSANKEHLVGYSGVDNETGKVLKKSLKGISKSKVNPEYRDNNIHQQSGYDAEVIKVSRDNAKNIINKSNKRTIRTDDHPDYGVNDPVADHVEIINGIKIPGSGSQMKVVNDPKELIYKIATGEGGGKSDLSRYLNVKLDLPSDQVDDNEYKKYCIEEVKRLRKLAKKEQDSGNIKLAQRLRKKAERIDEGKNIGLKEFCDIKARELRKNADLHERMGKTELAAKERQQAANYEKVRNNIRDSGISTKEAEFARLHPEIATARDIFKVSHRAGLEQAKSGAVIGGSISIIKNIIALVKDEKTPKEAISDVVKDTGSAAALSYSTAFTGSSLKGVMQNSKSTFTRALSKTNLAATVVTVTLEAGKTLAKYFKNEIDGVQCFEELGEKGTGMISSAMFASLGTIGAVSVFGKSAAIGQIVIPIPVIGGLIGGMIGYALSSACYGQLMTALKEAKEARKRRMQIEAECEEVVRMIRQYRAEMETAISEYLSDHITVFHTSFDEIKTALDIGDIDGFISGANKITRKLGGEPQFENISEFESFMEGSEKLTL